MHTQPKFKKAERTQASLKIAITGPSGSGKTYSALSLASGISDKIAMIDTENHSASLYADKFEFDLLELNPPYSTEKYIEAIRLAEKSGYEVIIIDSISHQWSGEGGILSQKEQLDARGGNSFTNWAKLTPLHEKFKSSILQSKCHMICTMRSKQEFSISSKDGGKNKVDKLGLAPIQRDGFEYEFTIVFDLSMNHTAEASKDRTGIFDKKIFTPGDETGLLLMDWISSAKAKSELSSNNHFDKEKQFLELVKESDHDIKWWNDRIKEKLGKENISELNDAEYKVVLERLRRSSVKEGVS